MKRVLGTLCAHRHYRPEYVDGRNWLHVTDPENPLRFVAATADLILTPPQRFPYDMVTSPSFVWPVLGPPTGDGDGARYAAAACCHDWAYEHQRWDNGTPLTRETADGILWECLFDLNVDEWRIELMYAAVRLGGWYYWNKHKREDIHPTYGGRPGGGVYT